MQPRLLKRALIQIATVFVLIVITLLGYVTFATRSAKSQAEALCQAIPPGTSVDQAQTELVTSRSDPGLYFTFPGRMGNGYYGAFKERWVCSLDISNEIVVRNEVRLID